MFDGQKGSAGKVGILIGYWDQNQVPSHEQVNPEVPPE
jgi:hypothetical protein